MPVIDLIVQSAPDKSIDENSATLINWYVNPKTNGGKYKTPLYPTPGLTLFATINSPVRAMFAEHGVLYAIGGDTFYRISSAGVPTVIGTLNTSTGFAKMAGINQQIIIIDGTNGYTYNIGTDTWNGVIADPDFPQDCIDIVAQDEFGLLINKNSQQWNQSAVSDLTDWPVLAFASVSGAQNYLTAIASLHREIWLFQNDTIEVWDNLGTANFAFGRNQSVFIEWGCAAKQSVVKMDNTLIFLAQSPTGGVQVVRSESYSPKIISTPELAEQFNRYAVVSDAVAFGYQQEGHEFYVLTFPTEGVTWVYDASTNLWHQRQSTVNGTPTRWRLGSFAYCYSKPYAGDFVNGNIYLLDMSNFTENGVAITRTLITRPYYESGNWIFLDKVQTDWDEGSPSALNTLNLYTSKDGGRTYGTAKPNSLAGAGTTISGPRVYWGRLGAAKDFTLKIETSMNAQCILLGAWANVRVGEF